MRTRKIGVDEEENERLDDLSREDNDGADSDHSALAARSAFAHAVAVLALFGWIATPPSAHVGAGASDHTLHASFPHHGLSTKESSHGGRVPADAEHSLQASLHPSLRSTSLRSNNKHAFDLPGSTSSEASQEGKAPASPQSVPNDLRVCDMIGLTRSIMLPVCDMSRR